MSVFRIFILVAVIASLQSCGKKVEGLETSAVKSGQEGSVAGEGLGDDVKVLEERPLASVECMTDGDMAEIKIYQKNIRVIVGDTEETFRVNENDLSTLDQEVISVSKPEEDKDFIQLTRENGQFATASVYETLSSCEWIRD